MLLHPAVGHLSRIEPAGRGGFAAVAEQADKQYVKGLIMAVRSKVLEGHSLAVSLGDHGNSFNSLYRATVAAGEQSGFLDKVLENLADYEERQFSATEMSKWP